ncbi:hypothetical protein OKA04_13360 [Luteolibacter flavescens]|uniref:Uncharacterized protein n=1 Tax=Luteolibacter flavescens TaxID=1859460 RepID=A0ABT3FQ82_9BACT|nr:hypothetical protein [Luteolibacter flavescens]MCW1885722.1 hypothetical protein [Luteolibacter flavescens]
MTRRKALAMGCGIPLLVLLAVIGLLGHGMFGQNFHHAVDVPEHSFAPAGATSIEVFEARNISGVVCVTYRVSEADFRKFAAEKSWPLSEGTGPVMVRLPSADYPRATRLIGEKSAYLHYEKRHPNGGGILVHFIPSESRVYIDKSNR